MGSWAAGSQITIGSGAKVLGAITIGADSQIGANSVVIKPVPPGSVVVGVPGQVVGRERTGAAPPTQSDLPDPLGVSLYSLLTRVTRLEAREQNRIDDKVIRPPEAGVWHGEDFSI